MPLEYRPLSLEVRDDYNRLFEACSNRTSDYTFVNIWAWSDERGYELAGAEDLFWPRVTRHGTTCWAPVGDWENADWERIMRDLFPGGMTFHRVPEALASIWRERLGDGVRLEDQRSEWEYVYSATDLADHRGNRFHKKKNLVRQFRREYESEYRRLAEGDVDEALEMQQLWCEWKNCDDIPGLRAENHAIARVLRNWDSLPGLVCGALYVKDFMVAYSVGEPMTDDMVVVHFEKGLADYKGVYQAINQAFVERSCAGYAWINREQDMGEEGLRQAKESYNPSRFLKKYLAEWKGR